MAVSFYFIFYPALIAFLMSLTSALIILLIYKDHSYNELLILGAGFVSYSYLPLNHLIFSFLTGVEYEALRILLGRVAVISGTFSPLIVWFSLHRLTGEKLRPRHYLLIILLPAIMGYTLRSYSAVWMDDMWLIQYNPRYVLGFNGIMIFWALIETIHISYINYQEASDEKINHALTLIGWTTTLLASIVLIIERVILGLNSRVFIIFGGLGAIIIAIALSRDPFAIVPRTIGSKQIIISDKKSGGEVYSLDFINYETEKNPKSRALFSSVMSGILNILEEITGEKDIPRSFGYANYTILIEESEHLICFLICNRENHPVRVELKNLLDELEEQQFYGIVQSESEKNTLHNIIIKKLNFAL